MNSDYVFAIWIGMALLASVISIRLGISVALVEILVGAVLGNIPGLKEHIQQTDVTTFLAGAGSLMLTFLAGAEIDPVSSIASRMISIVMPATLMSICSEVMPFEVPATLKSMSPR